MLCPGRFILVESVSGTACIHALLWNTYWNKDLVRIKVFGRYSVRKWRSLSKPRKHQQYQSKHCFIWITDHINIMNPKYFIALKQSYFQRPTMPKNTIILKQTVKECRCPIHNASFDTFKAKIGCLFTLQSTFKCPLQLSFWSK